MSSERMKKFDLILHNRSINIDLQYTIQIGTHIDCVLLLKYVETRNTFVFDRMWKLFTTVKTW